MSNKAKVLDLFSGIGGFSLGLESTGHYKTSAFCEIDPFCQKVLKKHWPNVPVYSDIKEILNCELGKIDVITGGYPCQPFSNAGKRKGAEDDRHLWPIMFEIIKQQRPSIIIAENVTGHVTMGLDKVLADLESEGYTAAPVVIPACAVDAQHRRDRVWIIAHAKSERVRAHASTQAPAKKERTKLLKKNGEALSDDYHKVCATLADSNSERIQGSKEAGNIKSERAQSEKHALRCSCTRDWQPWPTEPGVDRVADGIPDRVDRIRSLGNSVVPQLVAKIGNAIYSEYLSDG
jgi:DNA (cytosine-5)-methyltransferase 1